MDIEELKRHAQQFRSALPHSQASLAPLIRLIVSSEGDVTGEMQVALAQTCDVSLDQVKGAVQAFHQPRDPEGAFRVCGDLICALHQTRKVCDALQASGVPVVVTDCFGHCYAAPAVQKPDGRFCKAVLGPAFDQADVPDMQVWRR